MLHPFVIILLAFGLDCLLGDPYHFPHPIRLIGNMIHHMEHQRRAVFPSSPRGQYLAGLSSALVVICLSALGAWGVLLLASYLHPLLKDLLEIILCYQILSPRCLRDESDKVYHALISGDLAASRHALSMIVGRDTASLDQSQIAKAAVETVAENTCDGVIAPLFYMALGGAPLAMAYKAINTLDSMIGYKNEKYLYFGRFAAKLDDAANFIPARLSAWLMIAAAYLTGLKGKNACKIYLRDRKNHSSPNSAQTESVCAGALGVQLAGDAYYFGKLYAKPTIGDPTRPIEAADIRRSHRLMYGTTLLMLLLIWAALWRSGIWFTL